eukprot:g3663.t1
MGRKGLDEAKAAAKAFNALQKTTLSVRDVRPVQIGTDGGMAYADLPVQRGGQVYVFPDGHDGWNHLAAGNATSPQALFLHWPARWVGLNTLDDPAGMERIRRGFQWAPRVANTARAFVDRHTGGGRVPFVALHERWAPKADKFEGTPILEPAEARKRLQQLKDRGMLPTPVPPTGRVPPGARPFLFRASNKPIRSSSPRTTPAAGPPSPTELAYADSAEWVALAEEFGLDFKFFEPPPEMPPDIISVVEMAICEYAAAFIGSKGSTWSAMVELRRSWLYRNEYE